MQRAAVATIKNGYQYFKLEQAQLGQGSQFAGVSSFGSATVYGNLYMASGYGSSFSSPVFAPTSEAAATVVMFHEGEPGAKDAFNAADVVARLGQ